MQIHVSKDSNKPSAQLIRGVSAHRNLASNPRLKAACKRRTQIELRIKCTFILQEESLAHSIETYRSFPGSEFCAVCVDRTGRR